ncbi:hypothetical protein HDV02_001265 [Globomyces sp. JEL0801]|nr:hypothetical protein HDV02_001265 [Globomyces sp. JEL0801]
MLLLAQIHPDDVFGEGNDIFCDLYIILRDRRYTSVIIHPHAVPTLAIIDDVQASLKTNEVFRSASENMRTVFSPLWTNMYRCFYGRLILAGTGIDFMAMKDILAATCAKTESGKYTVIRDVSPMTEDQVFQYSKRVLEAFEKSDAVETALLLSKDPLLVNGRPSFLVFVLDRLVEGLSLGDAVTMLENFLSNPNHKYFPIRNWDENHLKCIRKKTYHTLVLEAVVSYLLGQDAGIVVGENDSAELINIGIGYLKEHLHRSVDMYELAIVQAMLALFTPQEISDQFILSITNTLYSSIAGCHLEYLVLIKFYFDAKAQGQSFHIVHGSLGNTTILNHLGGTNDGYVVLMPDIYAGPDLVVAVTKAGKTVYKVIQCKFTKRLDTGKAISTTDYQRFYCNRKTGKPLQGYDGQHKSCCMFFQGRTIERFIIHHGQTVAETDDTDADNVRIISNETFPNFFNSLGINGVWNLVADAQSSRSQSFYEN